MIVGSFMRIDEKLVRDLFGKCPIPDSVLEHK